MPYGEVQIFVGFTEHIASIIIVEMVS